MTKTQEFIKLQAKWYRRLEASGFDDIESTGDNGEPLEKLKPDAIRTSMNARMSLASFQAKEEYYRLAGQFLYSHRFKSKFERAVWEKHANGVTYKKIAETHCKSKTSVFMLVKKLAAKMFQSKD